MKLPKVSAVKMASYPVGWQWVLFRILRGNSPYICSTVGVMGPGMLTWREENVFNLLLYVQSMPYGWTSKQSACHFKH